MSLEVKKDFEYEDDFTNQEIKLLKVDILNKITELRLAGINATVKEDRLLGNGFNLIRHLADYEKSVIRYALELARYNQYIASQLLGIKYTTLNNKIKKYHLSNKESLSAINPGSQES